MQIKAGYANQMAKGRGQDLTATPRVMQIRGQAVCGCMQIKREAPPLYANKTAGGLYQWQGARLYANEPRAMLMSGGPDWPPAEGGAGRVLARAGRKRAGSGSGSGGGRCGGGPRMLRLRCKARSGSHALPGLSPHSRLRDMQAALAALTGVPAPAQRLLHGFPPRSLDLSDGERRLGELGIHSGEGPSGNRVGTALCGLCRLAGHNYVN